MTADILGIDLGGTKLLMLCDDRRVKIDTGSKFSIAACEQHIRQFISTLAVKPHGIGIAIPGLVDQTGRKVQACDVLPDLVGWCPSLTLADLFGSDTQREHRQIVLINDVKAAQLEEFHDTQPGTTGAVIMVGTGIGAAFQIAGKPLLGSYGWAGELGYLPIAIQGSGGNGQEQQVQRLDELASGAAMATRLGIDGRDLVVKILYGDQAALAIVSAGGHALGLGLAAVINLLNPAKIALGGGVWEFSAYRESALAAAESLSLPDLWNVCEISTVKAGSDVVALGAVRAQLAGREPIIDHH
jgi:glucokinase